jgi:hypothetical protein
MLPRTPYIMNKNKRQAVTLGGINYSSVTQDGDLTDSFGICARDYPYLSTRRAMEEYLTEVGNFTVFKGKPAWVSGKSFFYDGLECGEVTYGEKTFAAISNRLVIMPDMVYFDLQDNTLHEMGAESQGGGATITKDSVTLLDGTVTLTVGYGGTVSNGRLTVNRQSQVMPDNEKYTVKATRVGTKYYVEFIYHTTGIVESSTTVSFDSPNLPSDNASGYAVNGVKRRWSSGGGSGGKERITFAYSVGEREGTKVDLDIYLNAVRGFTDTDSVGRRVTIESAHGNLTGIIEAVTETESCPKFTIIAENGMIEGGEYQANVMIKNWEKPLSEYCKVGDYISAYYPYPTQQGMQDRYFFSSTKVTAVGNDFIVTTGTNTVNLGNDTSITLQGKVTTTPDLTKVFKVGDVVFLEGTAKNNTSFKIKSIEGNKVTAESEIFTVETCEEVVTLKRKIPDMDHICSFENRIYGCSSSANTIYASALGDPTNFFDYTGISTDSYAVAVGSEGEFTGCIGYGGSVLFFKEDAIHRLMGSFPAEYALYEYTTEGVQKGSHKSLVIINETLYYKGVHGVFAYNNSPILISQNLGERRFFDAVAGSDGDTYYISMTNDDGYKLFAYETVKGVWFLEGRERVVDFENIGSRMYVLTDGVVYHYDAIDTDHEMEWMAQLSPFYETIEGRKSYSRLLFRVEIPLGSYIIVETRFDGGVWQEAGKVVGHRQDVVPIMVPVNRCDKFEVRLRGKGKCKILSLMREFYVGGDK